jgi:predicted MPP superfamily phosphohydrolase
LNFLYALIFFVVIFIVYSFLIEPNIISPNIVHIIDDQLYDLFHNKKVVQISDLHITSIGYREKKLVKMLNQINPDILFITGDFLTDGKNEDCCINVLQNIKKPLYGIWVVLGNTDRYETKRLNKNINRFIIKLRNLDINVLENTCEHLVFNENACHLFIVGVEGPNLSRSKLNWLLRNIPNNSPIIMLSHYPDILEKHADALVINLEESEGTGVSGWGWQDKAFFEYDSGIVRFAKDGQHKLRVQRRESGVAIEKICLVPVTHIKTIFRSSMKNFSENLIALSERSCLNSNEIIIVNAEDIPDSNIFGSWQKIHDPTADSNIVLKDVTESWVKNDIPLLDPANFFEATFYAEGGINYHVMVKMKADNDSVSCDSIYIQFNDSINQKGDPIYRIGQDAKRNRLKEIDLILAGHTHGGQFRLPIFGALDIIPRHKIKYDMGLFEDQGTKMYVNRGIGMTILPLRFLCSPEITVFMFMKTPKILNHTD